MIQNTKFVKNLVMELNNTNSNGWNVAINNLNSMILFFSKNLENWVK